MKQVILFFALAGSAFGQYTIGGWTAATAGTGGSSTAATPTFSPAAGTYTSTQTVTISTATGGAVLCYTTDGTTPTETANLCSGGTTATYSTPITVSTTQTVKAIATLAGYTDSSVGSALYTISAGCTSPTVTSDWEVLNSTGADCGTGVTCSGNGTLGLRILVDSVGSNNATQTNTSLQPLYYASGINSQPASYWTTSAGYMMTLGTGIAQTQTTQTWAATITPTLDGSHTVNMLGGASGNGLIWGINTSNHQYVKGYTTGAAVTGSATLVSGNTYTLAFTLNGTTIQLYKCSGGSCSTDGSSGTTTIGTVSMSILGRQNPFVFLGYWAGLWYSNTGSTPDSLGIPQYTFCKYAE